MRWRRRSPERLPGLDAVMVNYRTPHDLEGFVDSVVEADLQVDVDLVLANVAAQPADVAAADRAMRRAGGRLSIRHLPFEDNVGYAKACNAGLLGGTRDAIGLFNADTRVAAGALEECREALLANPQWGALGPRQVDQFGRFTASGIFGTNDKPKQRAWHHDDTGQCSDIRDDAVTVAGSAYFMRREVWDELTACPTYRKVAPRAEGAFLPTRLFYEETFCSYHAGAHGYRNVYYGPVRMVHHWHGSIDANEAPAPELFEESRGYFRQACAAHKIVCD